MEDRGRTGRLRGVFFLQLRMTHLPPCTLSSPHLSCVVVFGLRRALISIVLRVFDSAKTYCLIALEFPLIVLHSPDVRVFHCRLQFVIPIFLIQLLLWRI